MTLDEMDVVELATAPSPYAESVAYVSSSASRGNSPSREDCVDSAGDTGTAAAAAGSTGSATPGTWIVGSGGGGGVDSAIAIFGEKKYV